MIIQCRFVCILFICFYYLIVVTYCTQIKNEYLIDNKIKNITIEKFEQNIEGEILENKLHNARILRDNSILAINQLIYYPTNDNTILDNIDLQTILNIHQLLYKRIYPPTNLLQIIGKLDKQSSAKEQFKILFKQLTNTVTPILKPSVQRCLNSLTNNNWDSVLNNITINLLTNISNSTSKSSSATKSITNSQDTYQSISNYIVMKLKYQQIISTTRLVGELFGIFPLKLYTADVIDAEHIVYDYLLQLNEGTKSLRDPQNVSKMIYHILFKLRQIVTKQQLLNAIETILPVIYVDYNSFNYNQQEQFTIDEYQKIKSLFVNEKTLLMKTLFKEFHSTLFPADIVLSRTLLTSLFNTGLLDASQWIKNLTMYETTKDILLAVLYKMQISHILPRNLHGTVQALYIHAKVKFTKLKTLNNIESVYELLNAYENLNNNKQFEKLILVIKNIQDELTKQFKNGTVLNNFPYANCINARQCVKDLLLFITSLGNQISNHLQYLIQQYLLLVGNNGEPIDNLSITNNPTNYQLNNRNFLLNRRVIDPQSDQNAVGDVFKVNKFMLRRSYLNSNNYLKNKRFNFDKFYAYFLNSIANKFTRFYFPSLVKPVGQYCYYN